MWLSAGWGPRRQRVRGSLAMEGSRCLWRARLRAGNTAQGTCELQPGVRRQFALVQRAGVAGSLSQAGVGWGEGMALEVGKEVRDRTVSRIQLWVALMMPVNTDPCLLGAVHPLRLSQMLPDLIGPQSSGADTVIIPILHWRKLQTERFRNLPVVS